MITGNKGEWSEIYTLFKLLGDRTLYAGDADLKKVETLLFPIIKILRSEVKGDFAYELEGDIVVISGGEEQLRVPSKIFAMKSVELLAAIKGSNGVFSIPEIEHFMQSVECGVLKAKSTSKSDITIVIHDRRLNQPAEMGFSIKSQLGGDSTLLNAGKTTNFIFKINGLDKSAETIARINNIDTRSKIKDRISEIERCGGVFEFYGLENDIFKNNLVLIESELPRILSKLVKLFYSSSLNSISELTREVSVANPLAYDMQFSHDFYQYKIKRFLTDVALGMMPSKIWHGQYDATGGFLLVKEDGEVLCYHVYNRNQFEDYLFHNTRLETASSTRHGFGSVFSDGENLFFKLNLQIRFN